METQNLPFLLSIMYVKISYQLHRNQIIKILSENQTFFFYHIKGHIWCKAFLSELNLYFVDNQLPYKF